MKCVQVLLFALYLLWVGSLLLFFFFFEKKLEGKGFTYIMIYKERKKERKQALAK
jgi:hypothetical protein